MSPSLGSRLWLVPPLPRHPDPGRGDSDHSPGYTPSPQSCKGLSMACLLHRLFAHHGKMLFRLVTRPCVHAFQQLQKPPRATPRMLGEALGDSGDLARAGAPRTGAVSSGPAQQQGPGGPPMTRVLGHGLALVGGPHLTLCAPHDPFPRRAPGLAASLGAAGSGLAPPAGAVSQSGPPGTQASRQSGKPGPGPQPAAPQLSVAELSPTETQWPSWPFWKVHWPSLKRAFTPLRQAALGRC